MSHVHLYKCIHISAYCKTINTPLAWPSGLKRCFTGRGVAWRGFKSRRSHIFSFLIFNPSLFRTSQCTPCKWNQAWPFTWSHSCFRPQIRLIIQCLVLYNRSIALSLNWTRKVATKIEWLELWPLPHSACTHWLNVGPTKLRLLVQRYKPRLALGISANRAYFAPSCLLYVGPMVGQTLDHHVDQSNGQWWFVNTILFCFLNAYVIHHVIFLSFWDR